MREFCFSLLAAVSLAALSELLVYKEEYKKYVKFVLSLAIAVIILSPCVSLLISDDLKELSFEYETAAFFPYVSDVDSYVLSNACEEELLRHGIDGDVLIFYEDGRFLYIRVTVKLNEGEEESILFERTRITVAESLNVKKEQVYVYFEK